MIDSEKTLINWHDEILLSLLDKREENPNLKFWLRQKNTNNRLDEGYWFNGNDLYIHVGVTKLGAGNLSTQSIGFVLGIDDDNQTNSKIEITFRKEKDEQVLACYHQIIEKIGGFIKLNETQFYKPYESNEPLDNLNEFLAKDKPQIDKIIKDMGLESKIEIPDKKFERVLKNTLKKRNEIKSQSSLKLIIANITWNSKDWKEISEDTSGHAWVGGDNIPHESWNFDFENPRNEEEKLLGFVKFTNPPKVEGNNNLIIFYSQGKIVGFYGKTEVLKEWVNINDRESYNLVADKNLSVVLPNKIDNIKEKGYLEDLNRVGQVGFSYLKKPETAINILDEAIKLNPELEDILLRIKTWVMQKKETTKPISQEIEIEYPEKFPKYGQFQVDFRRVLNIPDAIKNVDVIFDNKTYSQLTLGSEGSGHGRIYFNSKKNEFTNNNPNLKGGEKIIIMVQYYLENESNNPEIDMPDLNQIFFGPPGTGKTYHTINEAIKIVDPDFYKLNKDNRTELKERFKLLLLNSNDNGQIGFSTFHQSFSYEDFVEGIKPVEPKENDQFLKYDIQEGVFKKICRLANDSLNAVDIDSDSIISLSEEEFDKSHFYKMSLGNSQVDDDQDIFDYCVENDCITIGFGESFDFTDKDEKGLKIFGRDNKLDSYPIQAMNLFKNYLKINNYVVISHGNNYVRAIGKVIGDYEYVEESPFPNNTSYNHFRKVEWIFKDKEVAAKDIYHKNLSQQTIYKLVKNKIKKDFFVKEKKADILKLPKNPKNFVLIIDEINRGNVSSIFGELITLIEKDKRDGRTEELSVILPYSKKEFKVPSNVYIVGTMNTADRSIEALDTALRRRFSFKEMPPKSYLISDKGTLKETTGKIGTIDVVKILDTINDRIEKLIDKDHKIGHSFFMEIKTKQDLENAFKDKVIPMLEEYFFGDFGKIGLVLGKSFITKTGKEDVEFADFDEYDSSIRNDLLERSVFEITDKDDWEFESIYKKENNS